MRSMKLFRLAVLFLIVGGLFAGTPALAKTYTGELAPTAVEPTASGQAKLWLIYHAPRHFRSRLYVTCNGLTSGAPYYIVCQDANGGVYRWQFTASATGTGEAGGDMGPTLLPLPLSVLNASNQIVLTGKIQ